MSSRTPDFHDPVSPSVTVTPPTPVASSVNDPSDRIKRNGITLEPSPVSLNFLFSFHSDVDFFFFSCVGTELS